MKQVSHLPRLLVLVGLLLAGLPALMVNARPSPALQAGATIGLLCAGGAQRLRDLPLGERA
jgi:hypothetical protein